MKNKLLELMNDPMMEGVYGIIISTDEHLEWYAQVNCSEELFLKTIESLDGFFEVTSLDDPNTFHVLFVPQDDSRVQYVHIVFGELVKWMAEHIMNKKED